MRGRKPMNGAPVIASDLRASAFNPCGLVQKEDLGPSNLP